eukprot:CAMPEP_0116958438 /NCGR_PEP_ID=MMETSP0467-20121206/44642_1 /TAXON_ID=283647 /ORGANISM="Mesodinium pulex, Strain SPMC105" /LENGTH=53 /DNA_ID=CAMNT_0004645529 /DNA_START=863 /DNA_END=1024 /DNA_ORIENTATION=-
MDNISTNTIVKERVPNKSENEIIKLTGEKTNSTFMLNDRKESMDEILPPSSNS